MAPEMIEKYISAKNRKNEAVDIHFKDRSTVTGIFILTGDYEELRSKNFWRIVNFKNLQLWQKTKDINLTRLFNGASFTRLSEAMQ